MPIIILCSNGRAGDAAVWNKSLLKTIGENDENNFPTDHVILGDSAFPLRKYLMKPYPQKHMTHKESVFNYRLSRARHIVENAFGILVWQFCIFSRSIDVKVDTVDDTVVAACSLHNWLRQTTPAYLTQQSVDGEDRYIGEIIPGLWRSEVKALLSTPGCRGSKNYTKEASEVLELYKEYFWDKGCVPWQWLLD